MATYLLDTSVIIDVLKRKRNRPLFLRELLSQGHLLACCPINVIEMYAGMRPKEEAHTDHVYRRPISWPAQARLQQEGENAQHC